MSRGHGWMQRAALETLCDVVTPDEPQGRWTAVAEMAADDRASRESLRRALKRLETEGHVELAYVKLLDKDAARDQVHLCARITEQGLRLLISRGQ